MSQRKTIEQCLQELGYTVVPIRGTSMWPLLKEGSSQVQLIKKSEKPLRKGAMVLYRRNDGTMVLHRILRIGERNTFLVCGDHQWKMEEVQEDQILAVAEGFYRNGQYIDDETIWYQLYKIIWDGNLVLRRCLLALLRLSGLEKKYLK